MALSRTGIAPPGGTILTGPPILTQADPCLPEPKVNSFTASSERVTLGQPATLTWSVEVPPGCPYMLTVSDPTLTTNVQVRPGDELTVYPLLTGDTGVYTLMLSWTADLGRRAYRTTQVAVDLPLDPQCALPQQKGAVFQPCRRLVSINSSKLVPLFVQAVGTPNTTVMIDNAVQLDLSGQSGIVVREGVTLVGGRVAAPGKPYQPGPRLFTTKKPSALLSVAGPRVRITGLRIQGALSIDPPEFPDADSDGSAGIWIGYSQPDPQNPDLQIGFDHVEIDHNEIYGWSDSGVAQAGYTNGSPLAVQVSFDGAVLDYHATAEPVYIHDNYIHHNLHQGKLGYGVNAGRALIERNVFDWNRHAITSGGAASVGYRAYRNLVLPNGGQSSWVDGVGWTYMWQFDVHGQASWCLDNFPAGAGDRECGTAGHDFDIQQNSFLYTAASAIKVRGTPQLEAVVRSNVFAHESLFDTDHVVVGGVVGGIVNLVVTGGVGGAVVGAAVGTVIDYVVHGAVEWSETGVLVGDDNQVGVTPYVVDSCDFDGDGIPDRFMTTGQTWWFSSDHGQGPWVYLNASTRSLQHGDVTLGYFDGDNLCDVIADGVTYSGGTKRVVPRSIPPKAKALSQ